MEGGDRFESRATASSGTAAASRSAPAAETWSPITASWEAATASASRRDTATWSPHNLVVDTRHVGITLGIYDPFIGGADNIVRGNLVSGSRLDGIVVVQKDRHSLLMGNIVTGSGDDGFDVDSRYNDADRQPGGAQRRPRHRGRVRRDRRRRKHGARTTATPCSARTSSVSKTPLQIGGETVERAWLASRSPSSREPERTPGVRAWGCASACWRWVCSSALLAYAVQQAATPHRPWDCASSVVVRRRP